MNVLDRLLEKKEKHPEELTVLERGVGEHG